MKKQEVKILKKIFLPFLKIKKFISQRTGLIGRELVNYLKMCKLN